MRNLSPLIQKHTCRIILVLSSPNFQPQPQVYHRDLDTHHEFFLPHLSTSRSPRTHYSPKNHRSDPRQDYSFPQFCITFPSDQIPTTLKALPTILIQFKLGSTPLVNHQQSQFTHKVERKHTKTTNTSYQHIPNIFETNSYYNPLSKVNNTYLIKPIASSSRLLTKTFPEILCQRRTLFGFLNT